jgi:hypothetical protein
MSSPKISLIGLDLILNKSEGVDAGRLWYREPDAISQAIKYAKSYSDSHDAVIRVYNDAGNVIETHESLPLRLQICLRSRCLQGQSPSRSELSAPAHHEQQNGACKAALSKFAKWDIVLLPHPRFSNGAIQLRRQ